MSSSPESSNSATSPIVHVRARSGGITEVIGDIFASLPSMFRLRPESEPSNPSEKLMQMISKITLKDIQGARPCGRGGFSAILMLEHPTKGKVALKRLHVSGIQDGDDLLRRTLREGDTWQDLKHPYVLPFLGILETPTDLYLISPYIKNGSLDEYLSRYPAADRERFLWETASAIAYLHKCGIIHCDIKASNILVSDDAHALLCDFGLARSETINTSIGLMGVGTTRFQSPELLTQDGGKTFASDAWAFGMTICQVLSGRIPFPDYNNPQMIDAVANKDERPPMYPTHSPSGVSYDRAWGVAEACWARDPAQRLSMQDARRRLRPNPMVLQGHTDKVRGLTFSPDGTTLVSASRDRTIRLWDLESGSQRGEAWKGHTGYVNCVVFSPDGRTVVSGSGDRTLRRWDVESGAQQGDPLKGHEREVFCLAHSPKGNVVASGSTDSTLRLWDLDSGTQQGEALIGHTETVRCIAFSSNGTTIASGSRDNTIRLWDVESRSQRGEALGGHSDTVDGIAFSPDGGTLVSGCRDGHLQLWDVESGSERGVAWRGHSRSVQSVAFSPDGRTIVSGSGDKTLQLWDVESRTKRGQALEGHSDRVFCVAFSPDGRTVASASADCTIRLWDI